MKHISIAIDGPSGAGKSTLARMLATHLGYLYVDTGAIYRSIGYYVFRKGVDPQDGAAVTALLPEIIIRMQYGEDGLQQMLLNGEDVTDKIRLPEVSLYASDVSAIPEVRAFLLQMQRDIAKENDVIMDGRDIGTVVLPDAQIKLFLTASAEDRARRRYAEQLLRGTRSTYEEVLEQIVQRDHNDSTRAISPLRPAEDAVLVDTTGNTLEKSLDVLVELIKEKLER